MSLDLSEIDERMAFARGLETYEDQRRWYSKRSGQLKKRAQFVDLVIIGIGALIAALPSLIPEGFVPRSVSVLGILIAVLQGGQRIYRSGETWPQYREASEAMKREMRMFAYGTGAYGVTIEKAKQMYQERLEAIIKGEQEVYFEAVSNASKPKPKEPVG